MIFFDLDKKFSDSLIGNIDDEDVQKISIEDRMRLVAKATLDRRLNSRDLKVLNYIVSFEYLGRTQEEISELLDLSRSNINKSIEKLSSFNYIEKSSIKVKDLRKRMYYVPKSLNNAGIIECRADEIIRVLNVSNVFDTEYKYQYCSSDKFAKIELAINSLDDYINVIEKYYYSDNEYARKKAYDLVTVYGKESKTCAINNLKSEIKELKDFIADTKKINRKLNSFSRNLSSNILDKDSINSVLLDNNAKFILFIDRAKDERFDNFKNKYLLDYIRFICMFTELGENEDFFTLYYENKSIELSFSDLIRMLGHSHRDVPARRTKAIELIHESIDDFIANSKGIELGDKASKLVDEILDLQDAITSDGVYNSREIALLLYALDDTGCMRASFGLSYNSFVELYNPDMLEMIKEYEENIPSRETNIENKENKED